MCCKVAGAGAGVQRYNVPGAGVESYNTAGVQSYNTAGAEKSEFAQQALVVCFCWAGCMYIVEWGEVECVQTP